MRVWNEVIQKWLDAESPDSSGWDGEEPCPADGLVEKTGTICNAVWVLLDHQVCAAGRGGGAGRELIRV